MLMLGVFGRSF